MRQIIKWGNRIVLVLTVLICVLMAAFLAPRLFGVKAFVVLSGSMEPQIPTGSVVFVNTKDTDVHTGDVVTYSLSVGVGESVYVTHRVNEVRDDGLIQTKGDHNENADGYIEPSAVTGTVLFHLPYLGYILDWLQNTGYVLLIGWVLILNVIMLILTKTLEDVADP